ncbi:MAG: nitrous oxidase accessory protein [Sulfurimonas sp.]|uniref:nitrous oxide reductase family maturation protein NosD n=1 Tax=Sulfurimonas sp. TaxID=2022749 RepID=UPI0039E24B79
MIRTYLLFFLFISNAFANPLQEAIDSAQPFSTITLPTGTYRGNITIAKPLKIIGNKSIIQGDSVGTVITIKSSNVILKNLIITNSGNRLDQLDAAVSIEKAKNFAMDGCRILNCLYGVRMSMVENSILIGNYISSKEKDISLKGDGLKLYYSHNNLIKNNTIEYVRDVTLNYSHNNIFEKNSFLNNRFATHLSLSNTNTFTKNIYRYNSVSMIIMGAQDTYIMYNTIESSKGTAGMGVVVKGVRNFIFWHNIVKFNAIGLYIDGQERRKGIKRHICYNEFSQNSQAIHFHAPIKDNNISHNQIFGNIDDIIQGVEGSFSQKNIVEYNYWGRYSGFDRDSNNIGDTSHKIYQYTDRLWQYNNKVKFFYASPVMTILDFLLRIAPFIEPNLLFKDTKPVFINNSNE